MDRDYWLEKDRVVAPVKDLKREGKTRKRGGGDRASTMIGGEANGSINDRVKF